MTIKLNEKQKWLIDNNFKYDHGRKVWSCQEYGFQLSNEALEHNQWDLNVSLIQNTREKFKEWQDQMAEEEGDVSE